MKRTAQEVCALQRGVIRFTLRASRFHNSKTFWVAALEDREYAVCNFAGGVVESQLIILKYGFYQVAANVLWPILFLTNLNHVTEEKSWCRSSQVEIQPVQEDDLHVLEVRDTVRGITH